MRQKRTLIRIKWCLVLISTAFLNALPAFAIEANPEVGIQLIGRDEFPITGIRYSSDGQCTWDITGTIRIVVSFSKTTSLVGMHVLRTATSTQGEALCPSMRSTENYTFPVNINLADRLFFARSADETRSIKGSIADQVAAGTYTYENKGTHGRTRWSGSFKFDLKQISGEMINVSEIKGNVFSTIPMGVSSVSDSVIDASTIITDENASATLQEKFGTRIKVRAKTILTRIPLKSGSRKKLRIFRLTRGGIDSTVSVKDRDYKVLTPLARIGISANLPALQTRIGESDITEASETSFSTDYQQQDGNGSMTVSVASGTVVVTDLNGNNTVLTAGEEKTIHDVTNRTSWVQPADGGILYSGIQNLLIWTSYPGAKGYLLEYNLPSPEFASDNTKTPEFTRQSILLTPELYTSWEDLVIFPIVLPEMPVIPIEMRIYPTNAEGRIINDSVSSDRSAMTFE